MTLINLDEYRFKRSKIFHLGEANEMCMNLLWASNALCGEAGELANVIKKIYRDNKGLMTEEAKQKIKDEVGDVFWYLLFLIEEIAGITLEDVMKYNLEKLCEKYGHDIHDLFEV